MDQEKLLDLQREPLEIEVVPSAPQQDAYLVAAKEDKEQIQAAVAMERELRQSELQQWASKQRLINNAPPTVKQLNRIHKRLKKGYTIVKAIKKVCSYTTWCKWKETYPEVAALEEQARVEYVESLMDQKLALANQPDRTKMGEIARDKIHMDELQNRIDRIDRLTEIRNKKSSAFGGSVIPIQINVGYGKKNP